MLPGGKGADGTFVFVRKVDRLRRGRNRNLTSNTGETSKRVCAASRRSE